MVERLRAAELQMSLPAEDESSRTDILKGKSIVISGTFSHHSRDEYKEMIERNGGKKCKRNIKKDRLRFRRGKTWARQNLKKHGLSAYPS